MARKHFGSRFFNWEHLGMFMIKGNEDLKPEKNNYVSLGTEYSNDNFFISGNVYGNFFRKKIEGVWRIYDMQYNFEYTNLAKQNLIGLETIMRWHFLNHFTMNATYREAKAKKEAGEDVKAFLAEKEQEYTDKFANPYQAAQYGYIDDVIEPRNTRFRICRGLAQLATKRQSLPAKKHGCMPM